MFRPTRHSLALLLAYFLIYIVWGSTYYVIGDTLQHIPPFYLGAWRFTAAGLLLLLLCVIQGEPVMHAELIRRSAISGIVLLFVDMAVIMLAQRYVTSSLVAIIASSTALWIMLLDLPQWKQHRYKPLTITGMLTGFAGVALLYSEQLLLENSTNTPNTRGILLLIAGCITWALGTLYAKYRSCAVEATNAFAGSAWQMLFAAAAFWICARLSGETMPHTIPAGTWLNLLYLILCGSLLAYSAYLWLLKVRPAAEVGTHAYVNPVVAIILGTWFGRETVSLLQIAGLGTILSGVLLVSLTATPSSNT